MCPAPRAHPPPALDAPPSSRDKILDVAEALFARRGYAGVGLREVATSVGLGKSSLFHHFHSKTSLYMAVLGRVLARIEERVDPVLTADEGPLMRLDRSIDVFIDALTETPTTARLLLRSLFEDDDLPENDPEVLAVDRALERLVHRLVDLFREGVEAGVFRAVSATHTLQTLIGATVYHFASGELGEELTGGPLFTAEAVQRRKREVKSFMHHGILAPGIVPEGGPAS